MLNFGSYYEGGWLNRTLYRLAAWAARRDERRAELANQGPPRRHCRKCWRDELEELRWINGAGPFCPECSRAPRLVGDPRG